MFYVVRCLWVSIDLITKVIENLMKVHRHPLSAIDLFEEKKVDLEFVCFLSRLLECCAGGFRVNGGGGGTNVVKSSSFSSLLTGFNSGNGERSTSLTKRDDSFTEYKTREIVILIKPG